MPVNICDGIDSIKKRNQKQKNKNKKYLARQISNNSYLITVVQELFLFFCLKSIGSHIFTSILPNNVFIRNTIFLSSELYFLLLFDLFD